MFQLFQVFFHDRIKVRTNGITQNGQIPSHITKFFNHVALIQFMAVEEMLLHLFGHFTGFTAKAQGTFQLQPIHVGTVSGSQGSIPPLPLCI